MKSLPSNGQIQVTHISESIVLSEKSIPFKTDYQQSANVELDQQQVLQAGQPGLSVSRVRIVYQDGQEVSRQNESETVVRAAAGSNCRLWNKSCDPYHDGGRSSNSILACHTKCMQPRIRHAVPERNTCYSGTSSGQPVQKGEVAVKYSWYLAMEGQQLYIPGYGLATIEDVCGGCVGKPWVDLGYSDSDYQAWGQWVTVYFLAPAPANIPSLN